MKILPLCTIASLCLVCLVCLAGCLEESGSKDKKSFTAEEFLNDFDLDKMKFKSFDPGDVAVIKDEVTGFDAKDFDNDLFPFHLKTELDSENYIFFAYISFSRTAMEYVFGCDSDISDNVEIGDVITIEIEIFSEDNSERYDNKIKHSDIKDPLGNILPDDGGPIEERCLPPRTLELKVDDAYAQASEKGSETGFEVGENILAVTQTGGDPIVWDEYNIKIQIQGTDLHYSSTVITIGAVDYVQGAKHQSEVGDIILLGIKNSADNDCIKAGDYVLLKIIWKNMIVWSSANAMKIN